LSTRPVPATVSSENDPAATLARGRRTDVVATIAQELRERREERGLSLENVREQLGIPLHYLAAMEGQRSTLIADDFYLIPYLRRYAEFLDVNSAAAVGRFLSEAGRDEPRTNVKRRRGSTLAWILGGVAVAAAVVLAWLALA
jgi:cytoskeleton protein RodZ